MVRYLGFYLEPSLPVSKALKGMYGVGPLRARQFLDRASVPPDRLVGHLSFREQRLLRLLVSCSILQGALKKQQHQDLERHLRIGSSAGRRHRKGLPTRGQRTRTNARTRKGSRSNK